jgi:hypothetical protein
MLAWVTQRVNFTYRYIDDVLSINNSRFAEFLPLIYPSKLEVKETTDEASSASFSTIVAVTTLRNVSMGDITSVICGTGTSYPFGSLEFKPGYCGVCVARHALTNYRLKRQHMSTI